MGFLKKNYENRIWEIAEPAIQSEGMELVCVECIQMKSRWIVRLYIDRDGGVTIDDCALISDQVGDLLDVNDVPPEAYTLEISSPGLDRPLVKDKDFIRFLGHRVIIQTEYKIDGIRNFKGLLKDYQIGENGGKTIILDLSGNIFTVPREAVIKAHLEGLIDDGQLRKKDPKARRANSEE
ncbi:MAG TPA: ribosome maturation factor RimP [Syntrophales bacterium]|jgi:ribosome maturation factor RimP